MHRLRVSLDRPLHRDGDPYDDGPLPDFTSGLMWLATGVYGLIAQWLPGTGHDHVELVYVLCLFALAWGALSVVLARNGWTMPISARAAVTALMMPLVALGLWATGGATSYLQPVLLFTALFIGWFFPPRLAWPLVVVFLFAYASPLLYDPDALDLPFTARVLGFSVAVIGQTIAMQILKRRLVRAEVRQRTFAQLDPLTGITNRRGFDRALERAQATRAPYAIVLFDLDDFKGINDLHGHPTGDVVLRTIAEAAQRTCARTTAWPASAATSSPWWRPARSRPAPTGSYERWRPDQRGRDAGSPRRGSHVRHGGRPGRRRRPRQPAEPGVAAAAGAQAGLEGARARP